MQQLLNRILIKPGKMAMPEKEEKVLLQKRQMQMPANRNRQRLQNLFLPLRKPTHNQKTRNWQYGKAITKQKTSAPNLAKPLLEANTQFGKDMYQTNINLVTIACVKSFSMDISKRGNISGTGEIMYVYRGGATNPVAGMTPGVMAAQYGGFKTNLKDGAQIRGWSFSGTIDEEGNIEINGLPSEKLDLFNTGEWQKITPWSPLKPDAAGAAMKGPFHLKMTEGKDGKHFAQVNDYLALNDKLIKKVHYQTLIVKTNEDIKPNCSAPGAAPEAADCPASEFIKTKVALTQADHVTVETSKTFTKAADGTVQAQTDNAVNVSGDFSKGLFTSSIEFHSDNSYECTVGIGISPESFIKGVPVGLSEKLELIYDSKCGWGVKASAAAKAKLGPTGAEASTSVEGVIFFNKGL